MDCAGCASVLEIHTLKLKGIINITTSPTAAKSSITYNQNILEIDQIINHINTLTMKVCFILIRLIIACNTKGIILTRSFNNYESSYPS